MLVTCSTTSRPTYLLETSPYSITLYFATCLFFCEPTDVCSWAYSDTDVHDLLIGVD